MATVFKRYGARNSLSTNYGVSIDVKTEYTDNTQKFYQLFKANLNSSLEAMGNAMKNRALITVPRKSGDLARSGRVESEDMKCSVYFGGGDVPYGAYQERGMRADGTHIIRHHTLPGTKQHFLRDAFDSVVKEGIQKYIK